MTSEKDNGIGSDLDEEVTRSEPSEQDQKFSSPLEDLLKHALKNLELPEAKSDAALNAIRESLNDQSTRTETIKTSEVGSSPAESLSNLKNRVFDLAEGVATVKGNGADDDEKRELEEYIARISSYFETESSVESSDSNETDDEGTPSISHHINAATDVNGDDKPAVSEKIFVDNFDCDYFDVPPHATSMFEEISDRYHSTNMDENIVELSHQDIASELEISDADEIPDTANYQYGEPQSARLETPEPQTDIVEDSSYGSRLIEQKLTDIGIRIENSERQLSRIENIEKHVIRVMELMESSGDLPISELTETIEKFKTDIVYNDQCTATALKIVGDNLEELSQQIGVTDVTPIPATAKEAFSPAKSDVSISEEPFCEEPFRSFESSSLEPDHSIISSGPTGDQDPHSQAHLIEPSDQDLELLFDESDEKSEPQDDNDISRHIKTDTGIIPKKIERIEFEVHENSCDVPANEFVEAAKRAARAASGDDFYHLSSSQKTGRQAAYEMRNKISSRQSRLGKIFDQEYNFLAGFSIKPLSSRYTAVVVSALFVAAGSTLIVGQIAPGFVNPVESTASKSPVTNGDSKKEIIQPSTGIVDDTMLKEIGPKSNPEQREFAGSDTSGTITERNFSAEKVRTHQYSANNANSSPEPVSQGITVMEPDNGVMRRTIDNAAHKKIINAMATSQEKNSHDRVVTPVSVKSENQNINLLQDNVGSGFDLRLPPATVGPFSLRSAAVTGNAIAQYEVATRLAQGQKKDRDYESSFKWFSHSAAQGYPPAQYRLGALYERGLGTEKDINRARIWYRRAAENGNVKAMHNLAVLLTGSNNSSPDYSTAAHWFEMAANYDLKDSQFNLAILYENGLGVRKNPAAAYKWVSLSALSGDPEAQKRKAALKMALVPEVAEIVDQSLQQWKPKTAKIEANEVVIPKGGWRQLLQDNPEKNSIPKITNKVRTTQLLLKKLGYDVGPVDGFMGKKTTEAITTFQKRSGDTPTGTITDELISKLFSLAS